VEHINEKARQAHQFWCLSNALRRHNLPEARKGLEAIQYLRQGPIRTRIDQLLGPVENNVQAG
jgi:hypothetical protein